MKKKVYIFLAEGFEEIEAITPIDLLRRANINIVSVSISEQKEVKGAHNIILHADHILSEVDIQDADMLILPGGMPGAKNLNENTEVKDAVKYYADNDKYVGAICAAPMVLGELNILQNKKATCYPGFEKHLHQAVITGSLVEHADKIITSKGAGAALQFSLKLVEILAGKNVAEELKAGMIV